MNLYAVTETLDPSTLWIRDILDSIHKEAAKKALSFILVTEDEIDAVFAASHEDTRRLALVIGCSLPWITKAINLLYSINVDPILVSVYKCPYEKSISSVTFNAAEGMRNLVQYLMNIDKKRIALFGFHLDTIGDLCKKQAFIQAMRENGQSIKKENIYPRGKIATCGKKLMERIVQYDAVICTNDLLAVYLICSLRSNGISIPNDLYITGFGNWKLAESFYPSITRMYTDLHELGRQAVKLHQYLYFNPTAQWVSTMLECQLQIRETTANKQTNSIKYLLPHSESLAPYFNKDPDIMDTLKAELFIRSTDLIDRAILKKIVTGYTYENISLALNISESNIKYRLQKMYNLINASNREELLAFAQIHGII